MHHALRYALLLLLAVSAFVARAADQPLTRIAFGSCSDQAKPQVIWNAIIDTRPELWLWLGDNIYADTHQMDVMKADYEKLASFPGYRALRKNARIEAIWDDHDYGENDAGRSYREKQASQRLFLDFFDEPQDSDRRKTEGIYAEREIGPADQRIQLILLDTRYFRSAWTPSAHPDRRYDKDESPDATMLGETQWRWLAQQLEKPAKLRLIASGIQVINDDHGYETWGNFPRERKRLFDLIQGTRAAGVIILSGDRHFAEISKMMLDYPLYDVTSSGMTHSFAEGAETTNHYREGKAYGGFNFGTLQIDWRQADPEITVDLRDVDGKPRVQKRIRLSELQPRGSK
ncbi:MAG: alkaline phosphatase family protein [Pseudomonadales bacterium]|nr:alkaline phosphatase family protein [Pseudomonadales bacterium]